MTHGYVPLRQVQGDKEESSERSSLKNSLYGDDSLISTPTLHPFLSHFPVALFVAACLMFYFAKTRNEPKLATAAAFNISFGLLMAVLAALSGMFASDLGFWPLAEVEGHQGYAFALLVLYTISTVYAYTQRDAMIARWFYLFTLVMLGATVWSGYVMVYQYKG